MMNETPDTVKAAAGDAMTKALEKARLMREAQDARDRAVAAKRAKYLARKAGALEKRKSASRKKSKIAAESRRRNRR